MIPVILSGGSGTRLWPLSRERYPKQFLPLFGEQSLIQLTVERLAGLDGAQPLLVVCNEHHRFMVAEQLRALGASPEKILLEPEGRNTAPAIALAALRAEAGEPGSLLLVLPADHVIPDVAAFQAAVATAAQAAAEGNLVTFGIQPTAPATGYGYIRAGEAAPGQPWRPVAEFVEKPDAERARQYLAAGGYYWNSGMFMFRADRYLGELERFEPEMLAACRAAMGSALEDADFLRPERGAFASSPSNSIDYAVMERTDRAVVVPLDAGWSDVGSWSGLAALLPTDDHGNVAQGDVIEVDTRNCYLRTDDRLLATLGVEDLVVVDTPDACLVAHRDRVEEVREIVGRLKRDGRDECAEHLRVYRPWGSYQRIALGDRFQAKLITVLPGAKISLQLHHHRAEHWIVVRGSARVTRGEETFMITENESTFIPLGTRHRLENPGKIPLEIVEVQSGSYLGEDDIVRFQDDYRRE